MVRVKSRYLLCEVCVPEGNSRRFLQDKVVYLALKGAVHKAHGEHGAALCGIGASVTYVNAVTGMVIFRFRKAYYRLLCSSLPFITTIWRRGHKFQCFFNCIHIGGTIRTCQKFLVRYGRQQLCRMLPLCTTEDERKHVRRAVSRCSLTQFGREADDCVDLSQ